MLDMLAIPGRADDLLGARSFRVLAHLIAIYQKGARERPSFKDIALACGINQESVKVAIHELEALQFIPSHRALSAIEAEEMVKSECPRTKVCEWCGRKVFSLSRHHHPIPKCKGGVETVRICGTCHADFHWLTR